MKYTLSLIIILAMALSIPINAQSPPPIKVRVKDVSRFAHNEKYMMVGYGVVVGLNGTGDSDESLIQRTIGNMMQNFNIIVDEDDIKAQNTACVMVTVTIDGFAHVGDMIQATVSCVGDSTSLVGGELLLTPVLGTDGEVWGIGQGPITTGGFSFGSSGAGGDVQIKNHPTTGMLTNGVKLLKEIGKVIKNPDILTLYLDNPDFTSAVNLADSINQAFLGSASALDAATIKIRVPREFREESRISSFISKIEQVRFVTDDKAKVVFNERTGTIVIGNEVKISAAAVCHGSINVNIKRIEGVSQPEPFARRGETKVINDEQTEVTEEKVPVFEIPNITTVGELVNVLNALGVTSRDIMIIFHALREAGALHAELEAL